MNLAAPANIDHLAQSRPDGRAWRIGAGVAVSLVAHIALLFAYRSGPPSQPVADLAARKMITVTLVPKPAPPPPPPVVVEPPKPPKPVKETVRAAPAKRAATPEAPTRIIAVDPAPAAPETSVQVPDAPAPAPKFNMDAARATARAAANDPDPAKAGTALAQFPKPELQPTKNERLGKAIAGAKRRDCKDGLPGGLLGPILIMFDKKDSGCKW